MHHLSVGWGPASHCYTLAHHNLCKLRQRTLSVTSFFEGQRVPLPVNFDEEFGSPFWFLNSVGICVDIKSKENSQPPALAHGQRMVGRLHRTQFRHFPEL